MCPHSQFLTKETCSYCTGLAPAYERARKYFSHHYTQEELDNRQQNDGVERTGSKASRLATGFYFESPNDQNE